MIPAFLQVVVSFSMYSRLETLRKVEKSNRSDENYLLAKQHAEENIADR